MGAYSIIMTFELWYLPYLEKCVLLEATTALLNSSLLRSHCAVVYSVMLVVVCVGVSSSQKINYNLLF